MRVQSKKKELKSIKHGKKCTALESNAVTEQGCTDPLSPSVSQMLHLKVVTTSRFHGQQL